MQKGASVGPQTFEVVHNRFRDGGRGQVQPFPQLLLQQAQDCRIEFFRVVGRGRARQIPTLSRTKRATCRRRRRRGLLASFSFGAAAAGRKSTPAGAMFARPKIPPARSAASSTGSAFPSIGLICTISSPCSCASGGGAPVEMTVGCGVAAVAWTLKGMAGWVNVRNEPRLGSKKLKANGGISLTSAFCGVMTCSKYFDPSILHRIRSVPIWPTEGRS